jgi:hypothetical protein
VILPTVKVPIGGYRFTTVAWATTLANGSRIPETF